MLTDIEQVIRDYLPNVIHMSLATCAGNQPWVCEVHFVFDDNLNLYFRSLASRRHSKEIEVNDNVAGNIVSQHGLTDKPRGIYFEGKAQMLNDVDENHIAFKLCSERFGKDTSILEDAKKDDGHKFYMIKVSKYYVFDARESNPSHKYELEWNS